MLTSAKLAKTELVQNENRYFCYVNCIQLPNPKKAEQFVLKYTDLAVHDKSFYDQSLPCDAVEEQRYNR